MFIPITGEQPSGPLGEWFVAVVVGVSVVLAILLVVVCALSKRKFAKYRGHKCKYTRSVTIKVYDK